MAFKKGDVVRLLDEDGEGIVQELLPNNRVLILIDDFSFEFALSEIIMVSEGNIIIHQPSIKEELVHIERKTSSKSKEVLQHIPKKVFNKVSNLGYPEIDLHIYELVDKPKNLTNSEMLQIQSFRLEQFIQDCIENLVNEFVVIHGVGEGVLRLEVRKILESHGNIDFSDADFREYGSGATHARVRGLFQ
jgi:hypothetical protein